LLESTLDLIDSNYFNNTYKYLNELFDYCFKYLKFYYLILID